MAKRRGESAYNINNIVIHMLAAKMEKLQYKVIMTPRYGAQLSPEEFSTAVTRTNTLLIGRKKQNGTENSICSWRVSDASSLIHKETEDEDGQVVPGAFGLFWLMNVSEEEEDFKSVCV